MQPFEITPGEVRELLDAKEEVLLLDVREHEELNLARISGIVHIPMAEIPMKQTDLDDEAKIVVICHLGQRSAMVTQYLREQGFGWVRNMKGGINAWAKEVDPGVGFY